jgi:hypothetical protein
MRAWQHRCETWAERNLGLGRWDFGFSVGQAKLGVFPEATMPCPILRRNLPIAARPDGPPFLSGCCAVHCARNLVERLFNGTTPYQVLRFRMM